MEGWEIVAVIGGLVGVASGVYTAIRAPSLERYRAALRENEFRFSRLHERRLDVIAELYAKLVRAQAAFGLFMYPDQSNQAQQRQRRRDTVEAWNAFGEFFGLKRIWLDKDLCDDIDSLNEKYREAFAA